MKLILNRLTLSKKSEQRNVSLLPPSHPDPKKPKPNQPGLLPGLCAVNGPWMWRQSWKVSRKLIVRSSEPCLPAFGLPLTSMASIHILCSLPLYWCIYHLYMYNSVNEYVRVVSSGLRGLSFIHLLGFVFHLSSTFFSQPSVKKTRWMGQARVEVLLRQQAFKPKADVRGNKLTGESGKSILGVQTRWR